jgi:hypothetical protein
MDDSPIRYTPGSDGDLTVNQKLSNKTTTASSAFGGIQQAICTGKKDKEAEVDPGIRYM